MKRLSFEVGGYYHVYNRGTESRIIFLDDCDFRRFIHYLNVLNWTKIIQPKMLKMVEGIDLADIVVPAGERLVELCTFCLMPNHYHLLLRELVPGGISRFLQRMGTAYTMLFNFRYERTGVLFQGKYKCKAVEDSEYLRWIIDYIHLNPKDLFFSEGQASGQQMVDFITDYPWSSVRAVGGEGPWSRYIQPKCLEEELNLASYLTCFRQAYTGIEAAIAAGDHLHKLRID